MERFDHIVAGSGISGLTCALLLALQNRRVLLLEKALRPGGSLARFHRKGIPFDTGFHFTGSLHPGGILSEMLWVLGLRDRIVPVFLPADRANRFVFESEGRAVDIPCGMGAVQASLQAEFPAEREAIAAYFQRVQAVCRQTSSLNLRTLSLAPEPVAEDYVSLQSVLDSLTRNALLKGVLSGFCMCYGVKPAEISFASHSRICEGLYESVARVEGGGEAFVAAFEEQFRSLSVPLLCGRWIVECLDIRDDRVGRFRLNTGEEVAADSCVLTFHPRHILDLLPRSHCSPAFVERVLTFEESAGFFSVFGTVEDEESGGFPSPIVSLFASPDMNRLLDPDQDGDTALVIIPAWEGVNHHRVCAIHAFEPCFLKQVARWRESQTGRRGPEYEAYKQARAQRIHERMVRFSSQYARMRVLETASILTFRDYLHSPGGGAYGVKQKVGQINVFGRLPLRNLYAAGQSAVLPGLVGAMLSAFMVTRAVVGKASFEEFLRKRLEH